MLLLDRWGPSMVMHVQSLACNRGPCLATLSKRNGVQEVFPIPPRTHLTHLRRSIFVRAARDNDYQEPTQGQERRKVLLKYVQDVQPQIMEQFADQTPPQVVNAMRQTITNMLGTLPPQFFTVTITTVGENLAQLMFSVMMTGYMLRNAQYRLDLKNSFNMASPASTLPGSSTPAISSDPSMQPVLLPVPLAGPSTPLQTPAPSSPIVLTPRPPHTNSTAAAAVPPSTQPPGPAVKATSGSGTNSTGIATLPATGPPAHPFLAEDGYAPGVQKTRVTGDVLRWHHVNGVETMAAVQYMELLEAELAELRQQVQAQTLKARPAPPPQPALGSGTLTLDTGGSTSTCELLEYLKSLDASALAELTADAGEDISDAMHSFIRRLMGTDDKAALRGATSESTAVELAKLLFWLMVVGYSLRTLEVRMEMERKMDLPGDGAGPGKRLPPGR